MSSIAKATTVDRYKDIYQPPELEGAEREKAMDIISSKSGSLNLIPVKLIPLKSGTKMQQLSHKRFI